MIPSKIPNRLRDPNFRFFLIPRGKKIPLEKKWNSDNSYPFFHSKLIKHINAGGNYGICTGYGNLIVLDFDSWSYYEKVSKKLPYTFTIQTANKKTYHKYYYLKGEMIKKVGIDDARKKRVLDIQAYHAGIVAPNSTYNRRYYEIQYDDPIAEISLELLKATFKFDEKKPREYKGETKSDLKKVQKVIDILLHNKIKRTNERHFECPFHSMEGGGNMFVFDDGHLHCFHCSRHYKNIHNFVDDLNAHRN